jgi:hypothetical protein
MNCPKCQTPAAAGVTHCKRCGTPLSAKAAAAPSSSDEIDLMPLEPTKPSYSAYEPPPGVDSVAPAAPPEKGATRSRTKGPPDPTAPPEPPADYVPKMRGANSGPAQSKITTIVGGLVAVIVVGLIAWAVFRTKNEVIVGKPKFEQVVPLGSGMVRLENIQVTGQFAYTLDIEMQDGELLVGFVQRSHKDPQKMADLKKLDGLETLKKGDKKQFTGDLKHKEQYSWMLLNDTKKPARAKVKFQTTAQ